MTVSPARISALYDLDQRALPGWPARSMRRLRAFRLNDPRDIDLSTRIVRGVVKQVLVLQRLIYEYSGRPIAQVDVPVQKIVAIALCQMRDFARVPTHAIVDDAVEQAKAAGLGGASGFVNAVLRKAATDRAHGRPIAAADPAVLAEQVESFPRAAFDPLARLYGAADALALCTRLNCDPPTIGRLIGSTTLDDLAARGVTAEPHEQPRLVVFSEVRQAQLRELADANLCQPQDPTSAATVDILDLQPGQRVLDRCAGRGTKTRQIVERVGSGSRVVAMDPSEDRLKSLRAMIATAGYTNVEAVNAGTIDALDADTADFDRVLIDAPCSNSGVFSRRPEARYHQDARHVARVVELQRRILNDTAPVVVPGGLLAYATCSVWPAENEGVVDAFLKTNDRFERVEQRTIAPNPSEDPRHYHDGGFVALLRRKG